MNSFVFMSICSVPSRTQSTVILKHFFFLNHIYQHINYGDMLFSSKQLALVCYLTNYDWIPPSLLIWLLNASQDLSSFFLWHVSCWFTKRSLKSMETSLFNIPWRDWLAYTVQYMLFGWMWSLIWLKSTHSMQHF